MTTTTPITPGIHDLPAEQYHALPLASNSLLSHLRKSPAHLVEAIRNPKPPTPAMALGEAVHAAVLEPHRFAQQYAAAPQVDRRTKAGKEAWAEFVAGSEGKQIVTRDDHECCLRIAEAVRCHPAARPLLERIEQVEASVVWDHSNGVTCKARIDGVAASIATLIDLKTTRDASRDAFERAIFNFGYYRQAAHYLAGAAATLPEPIEHFVFLAVEKEPPYAVGVYRLDDEVIQFGRRELDELLELWPKAMQQDDQAESYNANQIVDIALPEWAMRRMYHEIEHEL